jgi:hypothetical protein
MTPIKDTQSSVNGRIALSLALLGYLPFFALALAAGPLNPILADFAGLFSLPSWFFAHALAVYGAVILSFLGGIRWGVAMVGTGDEKIRLRELVWSVVPSLAGWAAVFMPRTEGLIFLGICFLAQGYWDSRLASAGRAPDWFASLRKLLTALVSITLIIAGVLA